MSGPQPAAVPDFRQSELSSTPPPAVVFEQVRRRVAIARAMAAKPGLLRFDDPTTGLDPIISTPVDDEIVTLRDLKHVDVDRGHGKGRPGPSLTPFREGAGRRTSRASAASRCGAVPSAGTARRHPC